MSKGQRKNVGEAPTGQSWDNMNKKINNKHISNMLV